MDLGLKEQVALVLAASKGLGRASAAALAAEGASVTIGARNKQTLEQTAQELQRDTGSRVLAVPADVTRAEDIDALVQATINEFGRIDILVNNAGGPPFGTFEQFDDAQWQAAFELQLLSTVRLIRRVLPSMQQRGNGRIINIVSTSQMIRFSCLYGAVCLLRFQLRALFKEQEREGHAFAPFCLLNGHCQA